MNDYAVFIISHKRPEVKTLEALKKLGYSKDYFIVVDDKDPAIPQYQELYEDHVLIFSKEKMYSEPYTDTIDNFKIMTSCIYPRNYCIKAAREKGYKYLICVDDDIKSFEIRYTQGEKLKTAKIKDISKVFEIYIRFMEVSKFVCTGFIMDGRLIGGSKNPLVKNCFYPRPTNCFILNVSTPFFKGTYYEDAIYAIQNNKIGNPVYGMMPVVISGAPPMKNRDGGGMTEAYEKQSDFSQFFHIKVAEPTSIQITVSGNGKVKTKFTENFFTPKILNERIKKK